MSHHCGHGNDSETERKKRLVEDLAKTMSEVDPFEMNAWQEERRLLDAMCEDITEKMVKEKFYESHQRNHTGGLGVDFRVCDESQRVHSDYKWSDRKSVTWQEARLLLKSEVIVRAGLRGSIKGIRMVPIASDDQMVKGILEVLRMCSIHSETPPEIKDFEHFYVGLECFDILGIHLPQLTKDRFIRITNSSPPTDDFFRIPGFKQCKAYTDYFDDSCFNLNSYQYAAKGHVARERQSKKYWDKLRYRHAVSAAEQTRKTCAEERCEYSDMEKMDVKEFVKKFEANFVTSLSDSDSSIEEKEIIVPLSANRKVLNTATLANTMRRYLYDINGVYILPCELGNVVTARHSYIDESSDDTDAVRKPSSESSSAPCVVTTFANESTVVQSDPPCVQFAVMNLPCFCYAVKWFDATTATWELFTMPCYRHDPNRDSRLLVPAPVSTETEDDVKKCRETYYGNLRSNWQQ